MQILAVMVLTILPGSWIIYGLRLTGIPPLARFAMAVALSPAVVGLQLAALEAIGIPFGVSAYVLVFLNLPCVILIVRRLRSERVTSNLRSWLPTVPVLALIVAIPIVIWSATPGLRTYEWETMLHTDVIYTIARDGVNVEEANLAGLSLAYGWIGHSYWSLIGWIGDWAPTRLYPFTNVWWIFVTFVLSYQLGISGLGLHRITALLGVVLMFLATNVVGMVLRIANGYSEWWARYFGDIRYTPYLSKFPNFDTMLWGMTLLIAMALAFTLALQRKVRSLEGLTIALLVGLGLIYPVLFPAGLIIAGCFMFLILTRLPNDLPEYTRGEMARIGVAILFSIIAVWLYLGAVTSDRDVAIFALSSRGDIRFKSFRYLGAMSPFIVLAALASVGFVRRRHGPVLLLALSAMALSAVYPVIDLADLEYKYVLAATICLAFLAAAALDALFQQRPRLGSVIVAAVAVGLAAIYLVLLLKAGVGDPGNLDKGAPLDESSFQLALSPSEPDAAWTTAIRENTSENTVVVARKPGLKLSVIVDRSMFIPSDIDSGHLPGYNLNQYKYLVGQRGYPAELYQRRLGVVKTLYKSENEVEIVGALHDLQELQRPVVIYFPSPDIYALRWLESHNIGSTLVADGQNIVWLVSEPGTLP